MYKRGINLKNIFSNKQGEGKFWADSGSLHIQELIHFFAHEAAHLEWKNKQTSGNKLEDDIIFFEEMAAERVAAIATFAYTQAEKYFKTD